MNRKKKKKFPAKYILLIMSIFCLVIIGCSVKLSFSGTAANTVIGYVIIPMQKGINQVGTFLNDMRDNFVSKQELQEENEALEEQVASLQEELNQVQIDQEELEQLQELYDMDQTWSDYDKVAASVIGKDSGNWFSTFLIDKGTNDGVSEGMNVIADGGLAGIVTDVGPNYATIRSIIDDSSNVSCKDLSTGDLMIVSGDLQSMNESGLITFSGLNDTDDEAVEGDQIVTSNISDLYLPDIPVGYVTEMSLDSNNLTKSGTIATIVDFQHLEKVFVILETKESVTENEGE
ncbi:MAG: rod shape-determining protein MreC [Lachnospiraceae bacterium]|nr:rod shape-determining protein MreC [Lachnospiraceae bacterium]